MAQIKKKMLLKFYREQWFKHLFPRGVARIGQPVDAGSRTLANQGTRPPGACLHLHRDVTWPIRKLGVLNYNV